MKKIPYGMDDFDKIIRKGYYYIDKTMFIPTIESQANFILFVRPRRMGKSLFVNMLMSYYDIDKREMFDELFGKLWIGRNKTEDANTFLVLKFDFSQVTGTGEELVKNFNTYCLDQIRKFLIKYKPYFSQEDIDHTLSHTNAGLAINYFVGLSKIKGRPVYLFIDEYDNFSNTILAARGVNAHKEITHGEGFYRDFFKSCKGSFDNIFMTGISPVTYDDLTSGFNIADIVTLKPRFNNMIGVTEIELRDILEYYSSKGQILRNVDAIVAEMKPWYDNFCFAEECYEVEPSLYNTSMVLRYISSLLKDGVPPKDMVDESARTDTEKLDFLVMAEDLENRERRIEIVREICANGCINGNVREQFPAASCGDEENFKSMLYYYGTLTYGGYDDYYQTKLVVPNRNMGELYLKYMLRIADKEGFDSLREREGLIGDIREAAVRHEWQPLISKIGEIYFKYSSIRNAIRGESDIQGFIRGLICLNEHFAIWPELELGKGYCDVLLVPRATPRCPTKYSYLIEIKYMKAEETSAEGYISEACRQLERYVSEKRLTESPLLKGTTLTLIYVVFQGQYLKAYGAYDRVEKERE